MSSGDVLGQDCMTTLDFGPTTTALAALVRGVGDHQLGDPTPCPDYSVADLCDHIGGLALAFTLAAGKEEIPGGGQPSADGSRLEDGWRERIAAQLDELAVAWRDTAAYDGLTMAGPVEMPGPVAALVALDEVTVHAWDLAVATGQPYDADPAAVEACAGFVAQFDAPPRRHPLRSPGRRAVGRPAPRPAARRDRARPALEPSAGVGQQFGGMRPNR